MTPSDFQRPRRLHPLHIVIHSLQLVRKFGAQILIPLLGSLLGVSRNETDSSSLLLLYLGSMLALLVVPTILRYVTFSYWIDGDELVTREGLLSKRERHIPMQRIQDIKIEQGVLHRAFGLTGLEVETAGGVEPEVVLTAIRSADAEALRTRLLAERVASAEGTAEMQEDPVDTVEPVHLLYHARPSQLVVAGLTSSGLGLILLLLIPIWEVGLDLSPELRERLGTWGEFGAVWLSGLGIGSTALLVVGIALILLVLAQSISVLSSLLVYFGFHLSLHGEDLQRTYGFLTTRSSNLPRRRIQCLRIEQGVLRLPFGLGTLRAVSAATVRANRQGTSEGRDTIVPIARRDEIDRLLPQLLPRLPTDGPSWKRVSPLAIRRGFIVGTVPLLLGVSFATIGAGPIALWGLAALPLIYLLARQRYRHLGYAVQDGHLWVRFGWLGQTAYVVPIDRIQTTAVKANPFDRRLGLATLKVTTAGSPVLGGPEIGNLPHEECLGLSRSLACEAATTRCRIETHTSVEMSDGKRRRTRRVTRAILRRRKRKAE